MADEIKISLKVIYTILIIIAIIAVVIGYSIYSNKNKKETEIQKYKTAVYDSLVCQFSCPTKEANINNETHIIPDSSCTNKCESRLKAMNYKNDTYSANELLTDNFFVDVDKAISQCKKENTNTIDQALNYTTYFPCNLKKIDTLRENYSYLR